MTIISRKYRKILYVVTLLYAENAATVSLVDCHIHNIYYIHYASYYTSDSLPSDNKVVKRDDQICYYLCTCATISKVNVITSATGR